MDLQDLGALAPGPKTGGIRGVAGPRRRSCRSLLGERPRSRTKQNQTFKRKGTKADLCTVDVIGCFDSTRRVGRADRAKARGETRRGLEPGRVGSRGPGGPGGEEGPWRIGA